VSHSVVALLQQRIASDPAHPFVTVVADEGRVELSAVTIGNWIAKTAGLLTHDLMLEPGDVVDIDLPLSWQALAWQHAVWRAGLVVGSGASGAALCVRDELAALPEGAREIVLVGRHLLGLPIKPEPVTAIDWSSAARHMPDRYVGPAIAADSPALVRDDRVMTHGELLVHARDLAARWSVGSGARVLVDAGHQPIDALLGSAAIPVVTGGSVLLWTSARTPVGADLESEAVTTVAR
jgi:uncharacterized protein (TIGR03089 family)